MSTYVERTGQQIGPWLVTGRLPGRNKRGRVLWMLQHQDTGAERVLATYAVIKLARQYGSPKPSEHAPGVTD